MLRACRAFFIPLLAVLCLPGAAPAEPFRYPEGKYGKTAELKYINGIPVLTVSGTPEQIGEAVGALAIKPYPQVLDYPRALLKEFKVDWVYTTALRTGTTMYNRFPAAYKTELDAMAKGSGADHERFIVGNTLFDLKKMFLCSAALVSADRSATGGTLLGRNLDYPSLGWIHEHGLVTVYRPTGKHAFASVGFPGLVGCLSGMNDAGLSLAILEVMEVKEGEPRFDVEGTPYALCYRRLLEECTTIEEAKKLLGEMKRTTLTNLVLADRNGVAVLEVSPRKIVERQAVKGVCACTNHFCTDEVGVAKPKDYARTLERLNTLQTLCELPRKITIADVQARLDDANLGPCTLQTMVFEPATLKLHLAMGEIPASRGVMRTIELGRLFKGE